MAAKQGAISAFGCMNAIEEARWQLPSAAPVLRCGLCGLGAPCLKQAQHTPRFLFHEATLLLVVSGQIDLDTGISKVTMSAPTSLLLIEPNTCADTFKKPGGIEQRFRSVMLTFSSQLINAFHAAHEATVSVAPVVSAVTAVPAVPEKIPPSSLRELLLDDELAETLHYAIHSINGSSLSDERLRYRLMDLLAALAERGHVFRQATRHGTSLRLRTLINEAPERRWTAREAGHALAMSEATLRRRLADEGARFEDLLIDTRMHHAMMLMQTTSWSISQIAQASGYRSRTRFAERFRARFGCLPSTVR